MAAATSPLGLGAALSSNLEGTSIAWEQHMRWRWAHGKGRARPSGDSQRLAATPRDTAEDDWRWRVEIGERRWAPLNSMKQMRVQCLDWTPALPPPRGG